jgi:hypothetical protein
MPLLSVFDCSTEVFVGFTTFGGLNGTAVAASFIASCMTVFNWNTDGETVDEVAVDLHEV